MKCTCTRYRHETAETKIMLINTCSLSLVMLAGHSWVRTIWRNTREKKTSNRTDAKKKWKSYVDRLLFNIPSFTEKYKNVRNDDDVNEMHWQKIRNRCFALTVYTNWLQNKKTLFWHTLNSTTKIQFLWKRMKTEPKTVKKTRIKSEAIDNARPQVLCTAQHCVSKDRWFNYEYWSRQSTRLYYTRYYDQLLVDRWKSNNR